MVTLVQENSIQVSRIPGPFFVLIEWLAHDKVYLNVTQEICQTVHIFDSREEAAEWAWTEARRKTRQGISVLLNISADRF